MKRGVEFFLHPRTAHKDKQIKPCPPFNHSGQFIVGSYIESGYSGPIVAVMHDYYSVSAKEQRQMALNTIALCEMKYAEQEVNNV